MIIFSIAVADLQGSNDLLDDRWHQICVTWSGYSGANMHFSDGKRVHDKIYYKGEVKGGGILSISGGKPGAYVEITQLQLWNRALSTDEIAHNVATCDGEKGNLKEWYDWHTEVENTGLQLYRLASQRVAPPLPVLQS